MTTREAIKLILIVAVWLALVNVAHDKIGGGTGLLVCLLGTILIVQYVRYTDKEEEAQKKSNERFYRAAEKLKAVCEENCPKKKQG